MQSGRNILANSFKSFESVVTQWRMFAKMTVYILVALLLLHLAMLGLLFKYHPDTCLQGVSTAMIFASSEPILLLGVKGSRSHVSFR